MQNPPDPGCVATLEQSQACCLLLANVAFIGFAHPVLALGQPGDLRDVGRLQKGGH
jgi:hypothetical protein